MLELWLASLVARLSHSLVLWLPVILSWTIWVHATLSFFHWLWRGWKSIFWKNDRSVEVWKLDDVSFDQDDPYYKYHWDHYYSDWGDVKYEAYYDKKKKKYRHRTMLDDEKFKDWVFIEKA